MNPLIPKKKVPKVVPKKVGGADDDLLKKVITKYKLYNLIFQKLSTEARNTHLKFLVNDVRKLNQITDTDTDTDIGTFEVKLAYVRENIVTYITNNDRDNLSLYLDFLDRKDKLAELQKNYDIFKRGLQSKMSKSSTSPHRPMNTVYRSRSRSSRSRSRSIKEGDESVIKIMNEYDIETEHIKLGVESKGIWALMATLRNKMLVSEGIPSNVDDIRIFLINLQTSIITFLYVLKKHNAMFVRSTIDTYKVLIDEINGLHTRLKEDIELFNRMMSGNEDDDAKIETFIKEWNSVTNNTVWDYYNIPKSRTSSSLSIDERNRSAYYLRMIDYISSEIMKIRT